MAALHSRILQERIFHEFYELWPERFTNVTNGVTQRRWVVRANPRQSDLITEALTGTRPDGATSIAATNRSLGIPLPAGIRSGSEVP